MAGIAEALYVCQRVGLDCRKACKLLGFPQGNAFLDRKFEGPSPLERFTKDLQNYDELAAELGIQLPLNSMLKSIFEETLEHMESGVTPIAIITHWERLNGN